MTGERQDEVLPQDGDGELGSPSPDDAAVTAEPAEPGAEELLARLQDAEREHEKVMDDLRRVAADFDNYRKRVAREQEQLYARAGERLAAKLLPVLDDLERALEAAEHHEEAKVLEGVRMTKDALAGELAVRLLDLVVGRSLLDAEHLVGISRRHYSETTTRAGRRTTSPMR